MIRFFTTVRKAAKKTKTPHRRQLAMRKNEVTVNVNLVKGIQTFKKNIDPEHLREAWSKRDYAGVMKNIPWKRLTLDLKGAFDKLESSSIESAQIELEAMPPTAKEFRMDMKNPTIKNHVKTAGDRISGNITKEGRDNIARQIAGWFNKTSNPNELAERIRGSVGLLPAHSDAVVRYREDLLTKGVTPSRAQRLSDEYAERLLTSRLRTIARTEVSDAMAVGQRSVWESAAAQGLVDAEDVFKTWQHNDECGCSVCESLDGQEVAMGDMFEDDEGEAYDTEPAHPNCGCFVLYDIRIGEKK